MKREISPFFLALVLIVGCIAFRWLSGLFPEYIPNVSPLMAVAFAGAMVLPRSWGWLVGPVTLLITELGFLQENARTDVSMFSWWTLVSLVIYAAAGGLGILIAQRKSLAAIIGGSLACSLLFYVAANTFSWWHNVAAKMVPGYSPDLAGWWQANTVGLPGYDPTWLFLRNGMAGDLFFVVVLLLVLDRSAILGRSPARVASSAA